MIEGGEFEPKSSLDSETKSLDTVVIKDGKGEIAATLKVAPWIEKGTLFHTY